MTVLVLPLREPDIEHPTPTRQAPMTLATCTPIESASLRRTRARDVEAFHAVQASRPLRPPPYKFEQRARTPAELEAIADRKRGIA